MTERMGRVKKMLLWAVPAVAIVAAVGLGVIVSIIEAAVWDYAALAQTAHPHPNDDAMALIEFARSEEHSLLERNHAVWALGSLRDPRALPLLQGLYTGQTCAHDTSLCQYELQKAISRCGGDSSE